jgi:hypothetical protein
MNDNDRACVNTTKGFGSRVLLIVVVQHGNEMEFRGPEVGSVLLSINGVRLVGLDQDQVIALLTHPSRPCKCRVGSRCQRVMVRAW